MANSYIRCLDEGHYVVGNFPHESDCNTALMINPNASPSVLLDSAAARIARVVDLTKPWLDLENEEFDLSLKDSIRMILSICAMSQEIQILLRALQDIDASNTFRSAQGELHD